MLGSPGAGAQPRQSLKVPELRPSPSPGPWLARRARAVSPGTAQVFRPCLRPCARGSARDSRFRASSSVARPVPGEGTRRATPTPIPGVQGQARPT